VAGRTSKVRWHIIALLTLASFVAYLLRSNMSVVGPGLMTGLGLSQIQLGFILAAFAWGYALFQFPGGLLGERLGGRKGLALMAVLWGVINMLVGLVPGAGKVSPLVLIGLLCGLRFLMGVVQAPLFPLTTGETIARWFPPSGWAFPNALTNAGLTLGSAATGPLIAWLMERVGWRASFVCTGPLALVVAALWWWYVRDRPGEHPGVSPSELALITAGRRERGPSHRAAGEWRLVLADRNLLLITMSYFFSNYVFYFFFNWLYFYLVDVRKFTLLEGGAFAAAPWITGAVGATLGGLLCDRLTRRYGIQWGCRVVSIGGLLLAGGFLLGAATAPSPYWAVALLSLCLASQQSTDSASWAASISVGGRHASAACGVMNTGGNAVGGVGALLVPFMAQRLGWPWALASASLCAGLAALPWCWIRADYTIHDSRVT
jgi:ACS family glucarate transporter-like MFS transporter